MTENIPLSIIMKTTDNCNLACAYCYEGDKGSELMSEKVLRTSLEKIAKESIKRFTRDPATAQMIWHGGEPLLLGRNFYRKALDIQRRQQGVVFQNDVQSNLTLLDEKWISFFLENNFRVGGSFDGPGWANDISRLTRDGEPTTDRVLENILLAKSKGLNVGVITMVGRHNYNRLNELYAFFKEHEIDFEANMITWGGFAQERAGGLALNSEEYGIAITKLFDLWFFDKAGKVPKASSFMKDSIAMLSGNPIECVHSGNCRGRYVAINPNGDVYPCGRFTDATPEYKLGNILIDDLENMILSESQADMFERDHEKIEDCADCDYGSVCKAGCPYNALVGFGDARKKDYLCDAYKTMFSHIRIRVTEELKKIKEATKGEL
jgi:uncharacterized protein